MDWVWNLINSIGVAGALFFSGLAAWRGRPAGVYWQHIPDIRSLGGLNDDGQRHGWSGPVFLFQQLGPGTAERTFATVRRPGSREWSAATFGPLESNVPREDLTPRGMLVHVESFTVLGTIDDVPRGTWAVRLEWYIAASRRRRRKTWRIQIPTPVPMA